MLFSRCIYPAVDTLRRSFKELCSSPFAPRRTNLSTTGRYVTNSNNSETLRPSGLSEIALSKAVCPCAHFTSN